MDPAHRESQERILHDEIVPMVKAAPGFVSAHWSRAVDGGEHVSFVVFEDRASAEGFAEVVKSDPHRRDEHGVEPVSLTVTEIIATA